METPEKYDHFGMSPEDSKYYWALMNSLVSSSSILSIEYYLKSRCDKPEEQKKLLKIFTLILKNISLSNPNFSDFYLKYSIGIHINMFFRHMKDIDVYVDHIHFLACAFDAFYPHVNMYIMFVIIPFLTRGYPLDMSMSDQEGKSEVKIFDYMESSCDINSTERKIFSDINKRYKPYHAGFLMSMIDCEHRHQEISIIIDEPSLTHRMMTVEDLETAIHMHSNKIVFDNLDCSVMTPEIKGLLFRTAMACSNLPVAEQFKEYSDYLREGTIDFIISQIKRTRAHPGILKRLLEIAISKNVTLSSRHISKIPMEWRIKMINTYRQPRWYNLDEASIEHYSIHLNIEDFKKETVAERLHEFQTYLCEGGEKGLHISKERLELLINGINSQNKKYYKSLVARPSDLLEAEDKKLEFAHDTSLMGHDVFMIPRHYVIPYRSENRIFLFEHSSINSIIDSGHNPYTRKPFNQKDLERFEAIDIKSLTRCSIEHDSIDDVLEELAIGRKIKSTSHNSSRNYIEKLSIRLKQRNISAQDIYNADFHDVAFKMALVGIDFQEAQSKEEFYQLLYEHIKNVEPEYQERIRMALASVIKIHNKFGPIIG